MAVTYDRINPQHYADYGQYAPIYVITEWGLGFELGQTLKYIQRSGKKPGEDQVIDLKKARWYLDRKIHLIDPENEPDPAVLAASLKLKERSK